MDRPYPLGKLLITPLAAKRLTDDDALKALAMHVMDCWSMYNDEELADIEQSKYTEPLMTTWSSDGIARALVITEADLSTTTILLPIEYHRGTDKLSVVEYKPKNG